MDCRCRIVALAFVDVCLKPDQTSVELAGIYHWRESSLCRVMEVVEAEDEEESQQPQEEEDNKHKDNDNDEDEEDKRDNEEAADDEDEVLTLDAVTEACHCPICCDFFSDPAGTPCDHWFCRRCIESCLPFHNWQCPMCREPVPKNSLRGDRFIRSLVDERSVHCRNSNLGCSWTGPRRERNRHDKVCLVNRLAQVQQQVEELQDVNMQLEARNANLLAMLRSEVEQSVAIRGQLRRLEEEADIDKATIESLRLQRPASESQAAERDTTGTVKTDTILKVNVASSEVAVQTSASSQEPGLSSPLETQEACDEGMKEDCLMAEEPLGIDPRDSTPDNGMPGLNHHPSHINMS